MDCVNISDIEILSDELYEAYNRLITFNLFIGSIILINTFTNMSILCNIRNKINEITNNLVPPNYK